MFKKYLKFALPLILGGTFSLSAVALNSNDITYMTETFPPLNFQENGKAKGISVDTLNLIFKKLGSTKSLKDIKFLPWSRSYKDLQTKNNTMLFSMTRTPEREAMFKWVGPVSKAPLVLTVRKDSGIGTISSLNEIKDKKVISLQDDVAETVYFAQGGNKAHYTAKTGNGAIIHAIKSLQNKRADVIALNADVLHYTIKQNGFNLKDYKTIFTMKKIELYYAFNINTPDEIITAFQNAFEEVKADGSYKKIVESYTK